MRQENAPTPDDTKDETDFPSVLLPTDEFGLVDLIDASKLTEAWTDHKDGKIDSTKFWEIVDAEVKREPRLAEDAKLFEESIPRP